MLILTEPAWRTSENLANLAVATIEVQAVADEVFAAFVDGVGYRPDRADHEGALLDWIDTTFADAATPGLTASLYAAQDRCAREFWEAQNAETLALGYCDYRALSDRYDIGALALDGWLAWRLGWNDDLRTWSRAQCDSLNAIADARERIELRGARGSLRIGRGAKYTMEEQWRMHRALNSVVAPTWEQWRAAREREVVEARERPERERVEAAVRLGLDPALGWSWEALSAAYEHARRAAWDAAAEADAAASARSAPAADLSDEQVAAGAREWLRAALS